MTRKLRRKKSQRYGSPRNYLRPSKNKYLKTEGSSGYNLFWDSSNRGTYVRGMK